MHLKFYLDGKMIIGIARNGFGSFGFSAGCGQDDGFLAAVMHLPRFCDGVLNEIPSEICHPSAGSPPHIVPRHLSIFKYLDTSVVFSSGEIFLTE